MSEQLIEQWQSSGDEQAAEALYQAHYKRVYRLIYALLSGADGAEQVMQETMVHALTNIQLFDARRSSFSTWLHTIAVARCRDRQRRHAVDSSSEIAAERQESRHEIWGALAQLSPQLREALVLRYWSGHSYQEMAQILRCPLPTAQSRVRLAYEQLRKLLNSGGENALGGASWNE